MSATTAQTESSAPPVGAPFSGVRADVCLLLEGTWPYVRGGVSTWVHQILTSMSDVSFSVVFIGAEKDAAGSAKYQAPPNLVSFQELFLFDPDDTALPGNGRPSKQQWSEAHSALRALLLPDSPATPNGEADARLADAFLALAPLADRVSFEKFWNHPGTWDLLQDLYSRDFSRVSFIDFFWNARFLCAPVWRLLKLAEHLPDAAVYHSVSTGYAGLLGALAARARSDGRFLLSEHGIYVRERISELLHAEWTAPAGSGVLGDLAYPAAPEGIAPLRKLWIDFFVETGRFTYHSAASIVSLFQRNANIQAEFGAPSQMIRIIPNGVDLDRFEAIREIRRQKRAADPNRKIVGFFGRVVAIKDVKTLLRAAKRCLEKEPDTRFLMVGPTDEDASYFEECQRLTDELGIRDFVYFAGPATPEQALPEFDLMVLSSVSEGLPFAVLEAFASGMPAISTDVGSCAELIHGRPGETPAHGPAGSIVPVGDPAALGDAIAELIADRALQDRCGDAGLARARQYYSEPDIIRDYRELYGNLKHQPQTTS